MTKKRRFLNTFQRCVYLSAIFILVGCASKPVAVTPIALKCLGPDPEPPAYHYGDGPYPGEAQAAKLLAADLVEAKGYIVDLKAQMVGCR